MDNVFSSLYRNINCEICHLSSFLFVYLVILCALVVACMCPLDEQPVLLTSELSLQPPPLNFLKSKLN